MLVLQFLVSAPFIGSIFAGDPLIINDELPALVAPTFESRVRYGFGSQDTLDDFNAGTWRNRIGLLSRDINGFQFFSEYEGTLTVDRNSYNDGTGRGPLNKTVIADPESHELNQLWASYHDSDNLFSVKAGRQAINLDNQRFVGTVGWRQNMQTFDAASITLKPTEDLEVYYGYVWRVNRIFGSKVVTPALRDFKGNSHLFNAKYDGFSPGQVTTYAYLLDLHNEGGDINSNNTFGLSLSGSVCESDLAYYIEYAAQTDAFDSPLDYTAHYGHGYLSTPILSEKLDATLGLEYLGSDNGVGFKTPLATLHKFNGYADRFLATPAVGLTDMYGSIGFNLPLEVKAAVGYHHFWDSDFGVSLGDEVDLVLSKDLGNGLSLLTKGACFQGEGGQPDVNRATLELGYKY